MAETRRYRNRLMVQFLEARERERAQSSMQNEVIV